MQDAHEGIRVTSPYRTPDALKKYLTSDEYKLYSLSDKSITFNEFGNALDRMSEAFTLLKSFATKEEAVNFMMNETDLSYDECSYAYDFYVNLYKID